MVVYDKAKWQIAGGIIAENVIEHFSFMFNWLGKNSLLSEYGEFTWKSGVDESSILSDEMVTSEGKAFLDEKYDLYIGQIEYGVNEDSGVLDQMLTETKEKLSKDIK